MRSLPLLTMIRPQLLVEFTSGVTVVRLAASELIDDAVIDVLSGELAGLLSGRAAPCVLLNFEEVRLMSSTVLGVLLGFSQRVERMGGSLKLCGLAPDLRQSFRITRFDRLFVIHDDEHSALDAFEERRQKASSN